MSYKDLHSNPFDPGTQKKLEFFEDYTKSWLPTFIMAGSNSIHIFDLFAGPGYDQKQVQGSPIIILNAILGQIGNIFSKGTRLTLHLNEFEPKKKEQKKFDSLVENCEKFIADNPKLKHCTTVNYYNEDAGLLFKKLLPLLRAYPSLLFLDQNGVRFISNEYIELLKSIRGLDFLYFVSSSYFKRLGSRDEFQKVIPFSNDELRNVEWSNIHRLVVEKLRDTIGNSSDLVLHPFSIKKSGQVYGLIFGASHPLAVDKFLRIAWKKNETNGEADFDIDEDDEKSQLDFFLEKRLTKIEKFHRDLEDLVITGKIENNKQALSYTYETGNYYVEANKVIKKLKKEAKISFEGRTPGVNYNNVHKNNNIIDYKLLK